MLKVLLVDDEMLVRLGIKSCINFDKLGLKLIGEASNGREALDIVEKEVPEIILLDIRMPVMDGLEFMQALKQKKIDSNIIVLSCYNDFEYVKQALKLGAKDYILKLSIKPDELNNLLVSISESIYKSDGNNNTHDDLNHVENIDYIRNIIFNPNYDISVPAGLEQQLKDFQYVILKFGYKSEYLESADKALINIIREITKEYGPCIIIKEKSDLILFMSFDRCNKFSYIIEMSERIFNTIKNCLNKEVKISISSIFTDINSSRKAYLDACAAYELLFFSKESNIFAYDMNQAVSNNKTIIIKDIEKDIYNCLEVCDLGKLVHIISDFFDSIAASKDVKRQSVISLSLSIASIFSKFKRDNDLPADDMLLNSYNYISSIDNIFELKNWFTDVFIKNNINTIMEKQIVLKRKDIIKAAEYIKSNYNKKISLSEVSKHVNMSENYFSYLFKKEYNDTFINFQNNVKVSKAKELLSSQDYRVNELAEKLGYTDPSYFCKVFKKITGVSPEQFKKSTFLNTYSK